MNNLHVFDEWITASYGTVKPRIAVIGNGGISGDDQKYIDQCQIVIRFNNFATREGIGKTTNPNKCDILFSTFDLHSHKANPKDVVIGIPFPFKAKEIESKPERWYPRSRLWMINPYENLKMCDELEIKSNGSHHPLPSIGLTALWHMRNWSALFYVCGFEWYFDDKTGLIQGWDMRQTNYPTNWLHNYPKEILWIIKNLKTKNNFIFSDRCNEIIYQVNKCLS